MPLGAYRLAQTAQGGGGSGAVGSGGGSKFLAVSSQDTPFITIYSRTGDVFTKLANPASLPGGNSQSSCQFNALVGGGVVSSTVLATTQGSSPYINTYDISGNTFTKNANPLTLPPAEAHQVAFAPNGMLAVAHDGSPFMTVYTADAVNKLTNPSALPSGGGEGIAWNGNSRVAVGGGGANPRVSVYSVSGQAPASTLARVAELNVGSGGFGFGLAYTGDGAFLAVAHDNSPFVSVFSISGDTYTKVADPATLPASNGNGVAWNPDGTSLAVAHTTSPFVTIYNRSGSTLTKIANPADLPTGTGQMVSWSADGTSLAVSHNTSPFVTIYNRTGDTFTKVADPATLPPSAARGVDFSAS